MLDPPNQEMDEAARPYAGAQTEPAATAAASTHRPPACGRPHRASRWAAQQPAAEVRHARAARRRSARGAAASAASRSTSPRARPSWAAIASPLSGAPAPGEHLEHARLAHRQALTAAIVARRTRRLLGAGHRAPDQRPRRPATSGARRSHSWRTTHPHVRGSRRARSPRARKPAARRTLAAAGPPTALHARARGGRRRVLRRSRRGVEA